MSSHFQNFVTPGLSTWVVPSTMINGAVFAVVYGSPGEGPGADGNPGDGWGAKITGYIPVEIAEQLDLYIADGGSHGFGGGFGMHHGSAGGTGQFGGLRGGWGGSSSAVVRHSDGVVLIEAAGGGGMGGYQSAAKLPNLAGNGGRAGLGVGVNGEDGSPGGSIGIGGTPIGAGTGATTSVPGSGGTPPAGGTGFGQDGVPTGTGHGGNAGGPGDTTACGGGGGGGGGAFGGGGGAGGLAQGGGGGAGAGLGLVDPSVFAVSFAGYSYAYGSVALAWTLADAPLAPTWLSPPSGSYEDLAAGATISFQYNPQTDSGELAQWELYNATTNKYWDASANSWSSSPVWNDVGFLTPLSSNTFGYTFPAGQFTDGSPYNLQVATAEGHYDLQGPLSAAVTINAQAAPIVTVTSPAFDSEVSTITPFITWSDVLAAGPQTTWQILVYDEAHFDSVAFSVPATPAFYDSGVQTSSGMSGAVGPLPPGLYRAFVQVADANGVLNEWGSDGSWVEFTTELITYATPTFTAVAGVDPDNGAPVTILTVTCSDTPDSVSIQYSDDIGVTWQPVLEATDATFNAGTVADSSGHGHTGAVIGTPFPTLVTSPWGGFTDAFDTESSTGGGVDCGPWDGGGVPAISGTGAAAAFTLEARVQVGGGGGGPGGSVVGWLELDGGQPPQLWAGAAWQFYWTDDSAVQHFISGGTVDTSPHVLAADYDGTKLRLYLDGTMIASALTSGLAPYEPGARFWIANDDDHDPLPSIIDEVRWSKVARYASDGGYTPASGPFTTDGNTLALYHLDSMTRAVVAYDHSIPLRGQPRYYRARENGTTVVSTVTYPAVSGWNEQGSVSITEPQWWLSVATDGRGAPPHAGSLGLHRVTVSTSASSTDVPLDVSIEINETEQQGVFRPFGRSIPVVVRGDLYAEEFDIAFLTLTDLEYQTFVWLRRQRKVMILRSDMGDVYYGTIGADRPAGLLRAVDRIVNPMRVVAVHFTPAEIPTP